MQGLAAYILWVRSCCYKQHVMLLTWWVGSCCYSTPSWWWPTCCYKQHVATNNLMMLLTWCIRSCCYSTPWWWPTFCYKQHVATNNIMMMLLTWCKRSCCYSTPWWWPTCCYKQHDGPGATATFNTYPASALDSFAAQHIRFPRGHCAPRSPPRASMAGVERGMKLISCCQGGDSGDLCDTRNFFLARAMNS